jgi:HK97 family phage major capsid protein/HK97 family phage prohead protease
MNRAYAVLQLKALDPNKRTFTGIATTPATDRMGDIVEPKGAKFKLPLPLLWQHDSWQPIGWVTRARVTPKGIEVDGEIADVPEDGALRERLLEAWQSIKSTLVRGLSIGFTPLEMEPIDPKQPWGPTKFISWEWLELSAVTIAANQDASIQTIKSIDEGLRRAAPGRNKPTQPARAGAPNFKGSNMKTYTQEALAGLQDARKTKAARMEELRELKAGESRRFTEDERTEFDALDGEIEDLDDEIRVTQRHLSNISGAKPVDQSRGAPYGFVKKFTDADEKFKGETGLKRAIAEIYAQSQIKRGNIVSPLEFAQERWGKSNPTLIAVMKAAVAGGGTDSGEWGAELAQADTRFTGDFIEYLYAKTLFDQLPLVNVPHNVAIKGQDGAFTGYFIGQSKAIKVSKGDFSTTTTTGYKAAGLTVVSNELLRDSSPSALELCGTGLRNAVSQAVDSLFFSVTAVSAGVSPAGILNGVSIGASNGADAQSIATDIKALWAPFIAANNTEGNFVYITTPTIAIALSMMRNALGQLEFPGLTARGGTFGGYPLLTGGNVGAGDFILMNGSEVWRIGDLGVSLSTSDSAMIEQDSAPQGATDTPVAASATMVSMYQEDSTAIRVIRPISWGKRRTGAVAYIGDAAYGAEQS